MHSLTNEGQRRSDEDVNQRIPHRMQVNLNSNLRLVTRGMYVEGFPSKQTGRRKINVRINLMSFVVVAEPVLKNYLSSLSGNTVITSNESHHLCPIKYGMMLFRDLSCFGLMFVPFLLF
jgi:hypothetical protein